MAQSTNVGETERVVSLTAGACLAFCGLNSRGLSGLLLMLTGGALIYRGWGGRCPVYRALGVHDDEEVRRYET
jgi:uncharacterized membrane protein